MHSIGDIKWNFSRLAEEKYGKALLPTAVRWILDQGVDIAIWEGRRPDQLQPVKEVFGWSIDAKFKKRVEKIVNETITDPVGPEFMAPPTDNSTHSPLNDSGGSDDLQKVL